MPIRSRSITIADVDSVRSTFARLTEYGTGCWEWRGWRSARGYGGIYTSPRVRHYAHRVAYVLAYGTLDGRMLVCHRCDNRGCVRPDHLFLGTPAENSKDMAAKGRGRNRAFCGTDHHAAKLTDADVIAIRSARGHERQIDLAKRYGVSQAIISSVQLGRTWKHIGA